MWTKILLCDVCYKATSWINIFNSHLHFSLASFASLFNFRPQYSPLAFGLVAGNYMQGKKTDPIVAAFSALLGLGDHFSVRWTWLLTWLRDSNRVARRTVTGGALRHHRECQKAAWVRLLLVGHLIAPTDTPAVSGTGFNVVVIVSQSVSRSEWGVS